MRNLKTVNWRFIAHKYFRLHGPRTYSRLVYRLIFPQRSWEPAVWKMLDHIRGGLFVDVGAHRGVYATGLAKHFRRVLAFEPNPESYHLLQVETREKKNISIFQSAISDIDGSTILYLQGVSCPSILPVFEYAPASSKQGDTITYQGTGGVSVNTCRLDTVFDEKISLLKIDVEGAEFMVLEGASRLLKEGKIARIMVELHNRARKQELEQFLSDYDYCFTWVDPDHLYAERR